MDKASDADGKRKKMLLSWFSGFSAVAVVTGLTGWMLWAVERTAGIGDVFFSKNFLLIALAAIAGYTAFWMRYGWVRMTEGEFRFAEYGGRENLLRRVFFRDGGSWKLARPLGIPLRFREIPGCTVYVSVWENFLGGNRIMFRYVNLRTGEDIYPYEELD